MFAWLDGCRIFLLHVYFHVAQKEEVPGLYMVWFQQIAAVEGMAGLLQQRATPRLYHLQTLML